MEVVLVSFQFRNASSLYSFQTDEDIAYEEDILRNEFSIRSWQRYIDHKLKTKGSPKAVKLLYERALKIFNRSYKLWYAYLKYRRKLIQSKPPYDQAWGHLCDAYERCLIFLNKVRFYHNL